jgi:hypothetical protein
MLQKRHFLPKCVVFNVQLAGKPLLNLAWKYVIKKVPHVLSSYFPIIAIIPLIIAIRFWIYLLSHPVSSSYISTFVIRCHIIFIKMLSLFSLDVGLTQLNSQFNGMVTKYISSIFKVCIFQKLCKYIFCMKLANI